MRKSQVRLEIGKDVKVKKMDIRILDKDKYRFKGFYFTPEIIMLVVYMKCIFSLSYMD